MNPESHSQSDQQTERAGQRIARVGGPDNEAVDPAVRPRPPGARHEQDLKPPHVDAKVSTDPRPPLPRLRGDAGQVGGMEVLPFGFLLFVSVTLLFVNVWGVIDAKLAVTSAAREGARAYSESDDEAAARATSVASAEQTLAAYGRGGDRAFIDPPVLSSSFGRCARVTITVSYEVPAIAIPFLGGLGSSQLVTSSFTEVVDPYRDRLVGDARC